MERTCDAGALAKEAQGNPRDQQAKDDQDQGAIRALFSFTSSRVCTVLETPFGGSNQGWLDKSYFIGLPNMSTFTGWKVFWVIGQAFY